MNKEIMYFYISSLVTLVVLVIISILLILKRRKIYIIGPLYIYNSYFINSERRSRHHRHGWGASGGRTEKRKEPYLPDHPLCQGHKGTRDGSDGCAGTERILYL